MKTIIELKEMSINELKKEEEIAWEYYKKVDIVLNYLKLYSPDKMSINELKKEEEIAWEYYKKVDIVLNYLKLYSPDKK